MIFSLDPKDYCYACCNEWQEGDVKVEMPTGVAPTVDPLDQWAGRVVHEACRTRKIEQFTRHNKQARERLDSEAEAHEKAMAIMRRIEGRMDGINARLDGINARLDGINARLDGIKDAT